jgi:aminoglycoside phosphotransferase (APT) family kinase protein
MANGRTLMVKRARSSAAAGGFAAAREASRMLRARGEVVAPEYVRARDDAWDAPVLAYWKIERPTLAEVWEELEPGPRAAAMRSWGALAARVHHVRLSGYGALVGGGRAPTLEGDLSRALGVEMRATVAREWPGGSAALDAILTAIPALASRTTRGRAVLVHNDLHMENILCEQDRAGVRCVGVLDLEAAVSGPPEADLARPLVLYGPIFGALPRVLTAELLAGYGARLDPVTLDFYRALHLLNIGLHCARRGLDDFAARLAGRAAAMATALVERCAADAA